MKAKEEEVLVFEIKPKVKEVIDLVTDGKINENNLEKVLDSISSDAVKANGGNTAAARRFRLNTITFGKVSMDMRAATPKAPTKASKEDKED
jgi:hypothetical protein